MSIVSNLDSLSACQKEEMVASLAVLLVGNNDLSAEKLQAVATAAGCELSAPIATLFTSVASKCPGGVIKYQAPPGGGGGGGAVTTSLNTAVSGTISVTVGLGGGGIIKKKNPAVWRSAWLRLRLKYGSKSCHRGLQRNTTGLG